MIFTPQLQLKTLFVLNGEGRITTTREPNPRPGPAFSLIRSKTSCAWATRVDVADEVARTIDRLAQEERPLSNFNDAPINSSQYVALLRGEIESGPAFTFPAALPEPIDVGVVENVRLLRQNFCGWTADEIPDRSPILAVIDNGHAVSVCFCARLSDVAAEAGLETAPAFRGRGYAARVTSAWASAIRASGRISIYSTSWRNSQSLAVARKLGLITCASDWSVSG